MNFLAETYILLLTLLMVLETYINDLKASKKNITEFDEGLFYALVDKVKVNEDNIIVVWKDGTES